jgi:hypothetical protein
MNIKSGCFSILILLITTSSKGQMNSLIIQKSLRLPRDTSLKNQLIASLNDFLSQIPKSNTENTFVLKSELLQTSVLLDEMKDLGKNNNSTDENFYKPYLTNLTVLNDSNFLLQLSYMGANEEIPELRASFTIMGRKKDNRIYFYSPLKQNTAAWKILKSGNMHVFYKDHINTLNAQSYFSLVAVYDKKLNVSDIPEDFYCADNFHEALQLIGVDFKSDYNGYVKNSLTANNKNYNLNVNGMLTSEFLRFDPHDLWHERLHNVLSVDVINKPVDEGTAYLYGGSWGLSWNEILTRFKTYARENPSADWISLYNESKNFDEKSRYPLNVDFAINALIVQRIESTKGFSYVLELLSCGKKEISNENYFSVLQKITGITKADFNENIWKLIKSS